MKKKLLKFTLASLLMCGALIGCENTDNPNPNPGGDDDPPVVVNKYTVTYDGNGGTGSGIVDLNEYEQGSKVTVKANTFTAPEGKTFINWNEEADGSGSYHNVDSTFKIYENVTLYAQWLDVEVPPDIDVDDPETEHKIKVSVPTGITYRLSTDSALKDTEVTLTLTLDEGVSLNGNPTSQNVQLTKVSDLVYKFTMPSTNVLITVKGTIKGDVVLTGDINAELKDDDKDGIYTADIACDEKTSYSFTYVVKDSRGDSKRLSSLALDETRTDANVTFTSGENELMICGGATYTFAYDSTVSNYNCFITRKSIDILPTTSKTLYNLFDGRLRSQSTIHPQGLTSIHYTKSVDGNDNTLGYKITNETYDYKKISDKESFAVSVNGLNDEKQYVYKNIDDINDVYTVVNTYTRKSGKGSHVLGNNEASDNIWTLDPYGNMQGNRYYPYSAKQDIVENSKYRDTSRYEITGREAYRNVNSAAHYGSELEYEIYESIRGDFDGTAAINAANAEGSHCNITSSTRSGGFTVSVDSQLEYNHQESGSTADVTQEYAFVYKVEMVFKTNGDLYSLDYTEKYYTKDNWDFRAHAPISGALAITTKIKVNNKFDESFTRSDVLGDFNPDAYFIKSIDKLSFYDSSAGEKSATESVMNFDDSLNIIDYLGGGEPTKLVDEFKFSPETALDAWQYGFISSSDRGVADNTVYGPKTVGVGTCTVTFGNHLKGFAGATKDVKISVYAGGTFHSLFINGIVQGYDSFNTPHADYMYGYAGKTMTFYVDSSSNSGCPVSYWMVFKTKDKYGNISYTNSSKYFNVVNSVGEFYDEEDGRSYLKVVGHALTLDFNTEEANKLTSSVTVDIIFASNYYSDGFGPSTLHVVVGPTQGAIAGTKWSATYNYDSTENPSLAGKVFEIATIEFKEGGTGTITEVLYSETGNVKCTNIYNFSYTEHNNGSISASITSVNMGEVGMPTTASSYSVIFERQLSGLLGVALYTEDLDIFGYSEVDEEGYIITESLHGFERVDA